MYFFPFYSISLLTENKEAEKDLKKRKKEEQQKKKEAQLKKNEEFLTSLTTFKDMVNTVSFFIYRPHIVLHLLVGQSVGLSVDQLESAQYLLTPLPESCQTWYNGWPLAIDFEVTWSKVKVLILSAVYSILRPFNFFGY